MTNIPIEWMKKKGTGQRQYPITHLKAVRDDNGKPLIEILDTTKDVAVTCTTAAATAKKEVGTGSYSLGADSRLTVKFTNGISVANATLELTYLDNENVERTLEKPIYYSGAAIGAGLVKAGMTVQLRYNGDEWEVIGELAPSGFMIVNDETSGIDTLSSVGTASISEDTETGIDELTF